MIYQDILNRFMSKVVYNSRWSTCWRWKGSMVNGKPHFWFHGRNQNARRVVWVLANSDGYLGSGYTVEHKEDVLECNGFRCVNPNHLTTVFRPSHRGFIMTPEPLYLYEDEKPKRARDRLNVEKLQQGVNS